MSNSTDKIKNVTFRITAKNNSNLKRSTFAHRIIFDQTIEVVLKFRGRTRSQKWHLTLEVTLDWLEVATIEVALNLKGRTRPQRSHLTLEVAIDLRSHTRH